VIKNPGRRALKHTDVRETPRALFDELDREFGFTLDAAATNENALCDRYYTEHGMWERGWLPDVERGRLLDDKVDGLTGSWARHRVWCNPPFTMLQEFTDKAWTECDMAELIVMLVPANRTDRGWWQKNVAPHVKQLGFDVRWFAERHRFTVNGGQPILNAQGKVGSPSFACALLIWS